MTTSFWSCVSHKSLFGSQGCSHLELISHVESGPLFTWNNSHNVRVCAHYLINPGHGMGLEMSPYPSEPWHLHLWKSISIPPKGNCDAWGECIMKWMSCDFEFLLCWDLWQIPWPLVTPPSPYPIPCPGLSSLALHHSVFPWLIAEVFSYGTYFYT
jgi:hypothetical protein